MVIPLAKFLPGLLTIALVYNFLQDLIIISIGYLKHRQIMAKIKFAVFSVYFVYFVYFV